ncbi:hypothetical protein KEM54_003987, partial [Ascosphaera aggregata]
MPAPVAFDVVEDPNSPLVQQTLEAVRSAEGPKEIAENQRQILDRAIDILWRKVQSKPDSLILTDKEFALFNFFRQSRFRDDPIAQELVSRYWDNRPG